MAVRLSSICSCCKTRGKAPKDNALLAGAVSLHHGGAICANCTREANALFATMQRTKTRLEGNQKPVLVSSRPVDDVVVTVDFKKPEHWPEEPEPA